MQSLLADTFMNVDPEGARPQGVASLTTTTLAHHRALKPRVQRDGGKAFSLFRVYTRPIADGAFMSDLLSRFLGYCPFTLVV